MQLFTFGENAAINPALVASAQHHEDKGIMVLGKSARPLVYVEETDSDKAQEMLSDLAKAVFKADKDFNIIKLKDGA